MTAVLKAGAEWVATGGDSSSGAVYWTSSTGDEWQLHHLPGASGGVANAAVFVGGQLLLFGQAQQHAAAWDTTDPDDPTIARLPELADTSESVVFDATAADGGMIAVGTAQIRGRQLPVVWEKAGESAWSVARLGGTGQARALATNGRRVVIVGSAGAQFYHQPAGVWVSDRGNWVSVSPQVALQGGIMQAIVHSREGFVASGRTEDGTRAAAWTSMDGIHWRRTPDTPSFHSKSTYSPHAEMTDLVTVGAEILGVGWNSAGNGAAVVWKTEDGRTWARETDLPVFGGGGMASVAVANKTVVAVGSTGWPDIHSATVWIAVFP